MKVLVDKLPLHYIAQQHSISCYLDSTGMPDCGYFDYSLNEIVVSPESKIFVWFHELAHAIDYHVNKPTTMDTESFEAHSKVTLWQFGLIPFPQFLEEYNQLRIETIANKVAGYLCQKHNIPMDEHEQNIYEYEVDNIGKSRINSIIDYLNTLMPSQIEHTLSTKIAGLL